MTADDAIAVVGMAGRFPGASDVAEFWRNLVAGKESLIRTANGAPGSGAYGVLADVDLFDAEFFRFAPAEAELLDPQHRLFLECAWHALENASCPPDRYGAQTGVFASASPSTYLLRTLLARFQHANPAEQHRILLATDKDYLATRTSYKLDLRGPSIGVQTACSSSLVAVHLAARALAAGDCGVAVVGGATVFLPQATLQEHVDGAIISADGHCRPFDAAATGAVGGNGVAAVVLRRVADAVRDGNPIRAVILGSAVENDGRRKVGYAAPGWEGQVRTVSRALERASVASTDIRYVEAHGTGTPIGDPLEVSALAEAFGRRRGGAAAPGDCLLGSVKSNIGHLDATAGVTGLIKAVLALEHGIIPGTVHFREPNPNFEWDRSPFAVNASAVEWPQSRADRRCGVSSLGIGGTNAHVVLAGWAEVARPPAGRSCHVVTFSAHSDAALAARTRDLRTHLEANPDADPADLARTTQVGRSALPHRRFVIARNRSELMAALADTAAVGTPAAPKAKVAFLFPGHGGQYPNVGARLWPDFEVFRNAHRECLDLLDAASDRSLKTLLSEPDRADDTLVAQPALFAVEYALARTWLHLGVRPTSMIGHSLGEYVAAVIAGVMTAEDAARLVVARAELMQKLAPGAMLAAAISEEDAARFVAAGADVAAVNAAKSCVLSGPVEVLEAVAEDLTGAGIPFRRLAVSRAFHSRMTDTCLDGLKEQFARIPLHPPNIPFASNVTGTWITDEQATSPDYWVEQTRRTVRFAEGLASVFASGPNVVVELGPGRALSRLAQRDPARPDGLRVLAALPAPRDEESESECLSRALAAAWTAGTPVDWAALWEHEEPSTAVDLPAYPFQRTRHWPSDTPPESRAAPAAVAAQPETGPDRSRSETGGLLAAVRSTYTDVIGRPLDDVANFFDAGGDSLVAVQAVLALRAELGQELSLREFVDNPSIEQLTALLADRKTADPTLRTAITEPSPDTAVLSAQTCPATPTVSTCSSTTPAPGPRSGPGFSVFFFSADSVEGDRYGLILDCAQRADELGYTAIWTPERHFHQFGDLFPNPSVLAAGIATRTSRIQLRAGSVVAPLHHPARVAEEWAIVDNLSGGRVGLGFAPGFLPLDFVFSQASYQRKQQVMLDRIEKVRKLWRGESIDDVNGLGERVRLRTFPRPVQPELPVWLTAATNPATFAAAGRSGYNVLTALINLDVTELEERIVAYRAGRTEAGLDPAAGVVSVMVHAYLGAGDDDAVRAVVEQPFREYLWANSEIIKSAAKAVLGDLDLDQLTPADRETLMDFAFARYWGSSALLGGADTFRSRAQRLADMGVDEIACLVDFGLGRDTVVASLERIAETMALQAVPRV
ncbi:LLM class flavin-dependent oxidoreductase [Nocardia sp. NBC_00565]|uniref:type I polyketide synthase n=1 Tax=Nocardia sp. NBC_00565 TaxID=2975993 RepID=UPI002E800AFE|nr:MupA/Atu3671 family FMN-dependent luciferase-like monooxygenase [Nocardia sp. NBC_00565]WUC04023.1 LLM class flavin-dependent oxidoreductase [Nocardia sp. NBC_00565]